MPMVLSHRHRIHYRFEGERGPFLILYPPHFDSLQNWYRLGYVEQLQEYYRLILIDPLGQGRSDAPLDPEHYTLAARAGHILEITEELRVESFHFLGFGLGAQVGFVLATDFPRRLRSLSLAGTHPYSERNEVRRLENTAQLLRTEGMDAYIEQLKFQGEMSSTREAEIQSGSPEAYALALEAVAQWEGVADRLPSIRVPGLLITATAEDKFLSIREAGRNMPRTRYLILPELQFEDSWLTSELIVPEVTDFIRRQRWSG